MAIAVRGTGAATGASGSSGGTASVTPNLPTSSASDDRIYVTAVATGAVTAPAGWTAALASTSLGGGTVGGTTGPREQSVFYRDYDGVWTMPSFTAAGVAGITPGIEVASIAFSKSASETFNAPTVGSGSDTTAANSQSVTTGSFADPTGGIVWLVFGWPRDPSTLSALSLTASGATFGGNTSRHGTAGNTLGNDVYLTTWTFPVTVGATATHTAAVTSASLATSGAVLVSQTVSLAHPLGPVVLVSNPAALRAATR